MAEPDLVSTREAADILGKSVATVNRLAANGELPVALSGHGLRGARFYRRSDVEGLRSPAEPVAS